jgi:hypothetical protein
MFRALRDIYRLYADNRKETKSLLVKELRKITPIILKANAVVKYPTLDIKTAVSLYLEDLIVENLGLEQTREVVDTKVVPIKKVV